MKRQWPIAALVVLVFGGCGGTNATEDSGTPDETASSTTTTLLAASSPTQAIDDASSGPTSTLTAAELANSGIHTYSSEVEVLECGQLPPPDINDDRHYEVVVDANQLSYDDLDGDSPPLVWDRGGPDVFTREFTTDDGEHIAYTLTLDGQGMVYYYDIDDVPCRRITWTLIDE